MKFLVLFFTILAAVSATITIGEWEQYKRQYNKVYTTLFDDLYRKNIYITNKIRMLLHNGRFDRGLVSYSLGINQFSDMTFQEFSQIFTGRRNTGFTPSINFKPIFIPTIPTTPLPSPGQQTPSVDWRDFGAVTPVQDQGITCSFGWAFAALGALEGQLFRSTATPPVKLSEQNLIDCIPSNGQITSCSGQKPTAAYQYIINNQNVNTQIRYPNTGVVNSVCSYDPNNIGATCANFVNIADENALETEVQNLGPAAVGFDPLSTSFMNYKSGVYTESGCSKTMNGQLHYMTVVGFGNDPKHGAYWIVKNSFGTNWGEQGYIRVAKGRNECGIATSASYPVV